MSDDIDYEWYLSQAERRLQRLIDGCGLLGMDKLKGLLRDIQDDVRGGLNAAREAIRGKV